MKKDDQIIKLAKIVGEELNIHEEPISNGDAYIELSMNEILLICERWKLLDDNKLRPSQGLIDMMNGGYEILEEKVYKDPYFEPIYKCDFCKTNDRVGVYAVDHGPFSLGYCEECLKHNNIRTVFGGLSKWARFGDKAFEEYRDLNGCEPNVFFKGDYITLRELIKIITIDDAEKLLDIKIPLAELIIRKLYER